KKTFRSGGEPAVGQHFPVCKSRHARNETPTSYKLFLRIGTNGGKRIHSRTCGKTGENENGHHYERSRLFLHEALLLLVSSPIIRLSMILPGLSCIFREVPSVTPGASIGAKLLWRVGGRDLVCSRRESFTLGCVLSLSADGAF